MSATETTGLVMHDRYEYAMIPSIGNVLAVSALSKDTKREAFYACFSAQIPLTKPALPDNAILFKVIASDIKHDAEAARDWIVAMSETQALPIHLHTWDEHLVFWQGRFRPVDVD